MNRTVVLIGELVNGKLYIRPVEEKYEEFLTYCDKRDLYANLLKVTMRMREVGVHPDFEVTYFK